MKNHDLKTVKEEDSDSDCDIAMRDSMPPVKPDERDVKEEGKTEGDGDKEERRQSLAGFYEEMEQDTDLIPTRTAARTVQMTTTDEKPEQQLLEPEEKERLSKKASHDVRMSIRGVDLHTVNIEKPVRTKRGKAQSLAKKVASHFTEDSD